MGRVQDADPLQERAEHDQQERRREGVEDGGEEGQRLSGESFYHPDVICSSLRIGNMSKSRPEGKKACGVVSDPVQISQFYSHLNGYEHILVHQHSLWREIEDVIASVDAASCLTKVSKKKTKKDRLLYSPIDMNILFKQKLEAHGWAERRTSYFVTDDHVLITKTMQMEAAEQRQEILDAGKTPIFSYNQTDFIKERIEIEVQFGKYSFVAYDLFVKHMAFFVGGVIDVGVEILPMKSLQAEMSSGVPYYEGALYDLLRQGRSTPAVPLVLIGIAP